MAQAYRSARATTIASFEYIADPLSVVWGYVVWKELPGAYTVLGIALVVGSGLYVVRREALRKRSTVEVRNTDLTSEFSVEP